MSTRRRLIVFDSDGVNPYGSELAALLDEFGDIVAVTPADNAFRPAGVSYKRLRPTRSAPTLLDLIREVAAVTRLFVFSLVYGPITVVVWARTYQKVILLCAALAGVRARLVYVSHNPGAGRGSTGGVRCLVERLLLRFAVVVAHSEPLREASRGAGARTTFVVPHLPYRVYCRELGVTKETGGKSGAYHDRITLLLLGAIRPDKFTLADIERLKSALANVGIGFRLIAAVRPRVAIRQDEPRVSVANLSSDAPLSDARVALALRKADALLAPYRNATDSGTVMLALSAGVPVLAFETGAIGTHVEARSLVKPGQWEQLAEKCAYAKGYSVPDGWLDEAVTRTRIAWGQVIESVDIK